MYCIPAPSNGDKCVCASLWRRAHLAALGKRDALCVRHTRNPAVLVHAVCHVVDELLQRISGPVAMVRFVLHHAACDDPVAALPVDPDAGEACYHLFLAQRLQAQAISRPCAVRMPMKCHAFHHTSTTVQLGGPRNPDWLSELVQQLQTSSICSGVNNAAFGQGRRCLGAVNGCQAHRFLGAVNGRHAQLGRRRGVLLMRPI